MYVCVYIYIYICICIYIYIKTEREAPLRREPHLPGGRAAPRAAREPAGGRKTTTK